MKAFAVKEKRAAPTVRRASRLSAQPVGPMRHSQRAEVHNILRSTRIQPKLTVGAPNDKYEQEADRVADKVMRMSDADVAQRVETGHIQPMQIQRMCPECEEEQALQRQPEEEEEELQAKFADEHMQRQPIEEEEEELQAKAVPGQTPKVTSNVESRINSLKGGGQPLDPATRSFFEPRFGHDFSHVRVHADSTASETAKSVNARAFTLGRDVVFGSREYQPQSKEGKRLLGHELTHVVQQANSNGDVVRRETPEEGTDTAGVTTSELAAEAVTEEPVAETTCALMKYESANFVNKTVTCDIEFKSALEIVDSKASARGVKLYITDSFREDGGVTKGAIVPPATTSNHKAGHAIDMNVKHSGSIYNSAKMKKANLGKLPKAVKGFIQDIRDNSTVRWGGDFSAEDPVHIDDNLNKTKSEWDERYKATQKAWIDKCCK